MSRRKKTDGERIADSVFSGRYQSHGRAFPSELAIVIDRLIRKRMAEAWYIGCEQQFHYGALSINPYRRKKKEAKP